MMPLHKLEKLPRNQRLRKIEKIFTEAERRLCLLMARQADESISAGGITGINLVELQYLANIAEGLAGDALFPPAAQGFFSDASLVLRQALSQGDVSGEEGAEIRRGLNKVRHLLLAEAGRSQADWDFTGSDGRLDPARRRVFDGMMVYLEDIRSPYNVGAMFRTAESFGVEKIFLSPFCADPNHARARRTAMGCVEALPWERREFFNPPCPIFAMETGGIPLAEFPFPCQGLLIAGSEELGVSPQALAAADASLGRVSIPCYGAKGSLNVSVAFGIVMQAWAQTTVGGKLASPENTL
jgi:TrmH family RNA methyltransferase